MRIHKLNFMEGQSIMMYKKMLSCLLAGVVFSSSAAYAGVAQEETDYESAFIQQQAGDLIDQIDQDSLMQDALDNVVDTSVPSTIRDSVFANASLTPFEKTESRATDNYSVNDNIDNEIELEVNKTVQKVGEVQDTDGEILNVYAAAAATEVKEDSNYGSKNGVKAWAYVYWIDNFGINNQLEGAAALWQPGSTVVDNREVSFGTSTPNGLKWLSGPTTWYPTIDSIKYLDNSYTGLTLQCKTKIDIVNVGTLTVAVRSRPVT